MWHVTTYYLHLSCCSDCFFLTFQPKVSREIIALPEQSASNQDSLTLEL